MLAFAVTFSLIEMLMSACFSLFYALSGKSVIILICSIIFSNHAFVW